MSNVFYVWTAEGGLASLPIPAELMPAAPAAPQIQPKQETVVEPFVDNMRRTMSAINQYVEIPYNNILTTRLAREPTPVFKFLVKPDKIYKLNINLRAKVAYRFTTPIIIKYTLESNRPSAFLNYKAAYISSNETVAGVERTVNTLGAPMPMVVNSTLTLVRIEATFQTNKDVGFGDVELRLHHGIKTDDPENTLYAMEGSTATLTELIV